jgi:hypothetical protein
MCGLWIPEYYYPYDHFPCLTYLAIGDCEC